MCTYDVYDGPNSLRILNIPEGYDPATGFNFEYPYVYPFTERPKDIPRCVGTSSLCNEGTASLRARGGGHDITLAPGECTDVFAAENPAYLHLEPADRAADGGCIGTRCDAYGEPVCAYPDNMYAYSLTAGCLRPDQYATSTNGWYCEILADDFAGHSASAPILIDQSTPTVTEPAIGAICDLNTSCGNHVCDQGCEDASSCAADCAVTVTPGACRDACDPHNPSSCQPGLKCTTGSADVGPYMCWDNDVCAPKVSTETPRATETPVVTEPPPQVCGPGWAPVDECVCCGSNRVCPDHVEVNHPDCSAPGGGNKSGGGGGKPPVCGDGVCDASEKGCGVCSADCGPC